jgi:hypothetical protein
LQVGRVRGLGFSSEVVRETRKGAGLTYSLLSEAVHCFDRDMAKGAMKALQLDGQPLWDLLYSLACKEADAKEDDVRNSSQRLLGCIRGVCSNSQPSFVNKSRNRRQFAQEVRTYDADHDIRMQAREHRQYLFSLWPARANDGESRQSSVERW